MTPESLTVSKFRMDARDLPLVGKQPGFVFQVRAPLANASDQTVCMPHNLNPLQASRWPVAQAMHDQGHRPIDTVVLPIAYVIQNYPGIIQHESDNSPQHCNTISPTNALPFVGQPSHTFPSNLSENALPAIEKRLPTNTQEKMLVNMLPIVGQFTQNPGNIPMNMHNSQHSASSMPMHIISALGQHPSQYSSGHTGKVPVNNGQHFLQTISQNSPEKVLPVVEQKIEPNKYITGTSVPVTRVCPVHPHRRNVACTQKSAHEHTADYSSPSLKACVDEMCVPTSCQPGQGDPASVKIDPPVVGRVALVQQSFPRPPALIPIGYWPQQVEKGDNVSSALKVVEAGNAPTPLALDVPLAKHIHTPDDIRNESTLPSNLRSFSTSVSTPTYISSMPGETTQTLSLKTKKQTTKLPRARKRSTSCKSNEPSLAPSPAVTEAQNFHDASRVSEETDTVTLTAFGKQRMDVCHRGQGIVAQTADTIQCQSHANSGQRDDGTQVNIEPISFERFTTECVNSAFISLKDASVTHQGRPGHAATALACSSVESHSLTTQSTEISKAKETYPKPDVCLEKEPCDVSHDKTQKNEHRIQHNSTTQVRDSKVGRISTKTDRKLAGNSKTKKSRGSSGKVLTKTNNKETFVMTTIEEMSPVQYFEDHDELALLKKDSNEQPAASSAETPTVTDVPPTPGVAVSKASGNSPDAMSSVNLNTVIKGAKKQDLAVHLDSKVRPALLQHRITESDSAGAARTLKFASREDHEVPGILDGHTMPPNVTIVKEDGHAVESRERATGPDLKKVHEYCKSYIQSVDRIATATSNDSRVTETRIAATASAAVHRSPTKLIDPHHVARQSKYSGPTSTAVAQQRDVLPEYSRAQWSAGTSLSPSTSGWSQKTPVRLYRAGSQPDILLYPNGEMRPFRRSTAKAKHKLPTDNTKKQMNIKRKKDKELPAKDKLHSHFQNPGTETNFDSGSSKPTVTPVDSAPRDIPIAMSQFGSMVTLKCSNCENQAVFMCSQCRKVGYCSLDCQKTGWKKSHKSLCKRTVNR